MIAIKKFEAPTSAGSGVTISQGKTKGMIYWRIGINEAAQVAIFGKALDPNNHALVLAVDPAAKNRHILTLKAVAASNADGLAFDASMKKSVGLRVTPWVETASGKRPAEAMPLIQATGTGEGRVKLPEWARPPVPKPHQGKGIMDD